MSVKIALLWSDWIIYAILLLAIGLVIYARRLPHLREPWGRIFCSRLGMISAVVLLFYLGIGLLDSFHVEVTTRSGVSHHTTIKSVLDILLHEVKMHDEKTYSAPFATHSYVKALVEQPDGVVSTVYPRLIHGGSHLADPSMKAKDITLRVIFGLAVGGGALLLFYGVILGGFKLKGSRIRDVLTGRTKIAWRDFFITFGFIWLLCAVTLSLIFEYHIFGTDKIGHDVFYASIKSIRTGLLIGLLTTFFMLPFAILFGLCAGFFGGWIDDGIQYLYTTLSSIPGVLLISASILVMQVYISAHAESFPTLLQRADARLLALCVILGITSWASLCRLLRAETLKLRELEYVQAAKALGSSQFSIIFRHILPNVMHIVLITLVLDFSALVLAEAVLSYVGVGVDPTTFSWGNMINSSRLELAREPIVWWPLLSALVFMFVLVLFANLFSDAVRDALDPRIKG